MSRQILPCSCSVLLLFLLCFRFADTEATALDAGSDDELHSMQQGNAQKVFDFGELLFHEGNYQQAADAFFQAITLRYIPLEKAFGRYILAYKEMDKESEGYLRIGQGFLQQKEMENARDFLQRAIHAKNSMNSRSKSAEAAFLLSSMQAREDDLKAIEYLTLAIAWDSSVPEYHYQLGTLLFGRRQWQAALDSFRACYDLEPSFPGVLSNIVYLETRVCDWQKYDENIGLLGDLVRKQLHEFEQRYSNLRREEAMEKSKVQSLVSAGESHQNHQGMKLGRIMDLSIGIEPHMTLSYPLPMGLKKELAKAHALQAQEIAKFQMGYHEPSVHDYTTFSAAERIRIGYVSADFKLKATAYLIRRMFQHHDRNNFEVFCFATTEDSPVEERQAMGGINWREDIMNDVEHFYDVSDMNSLNRMVLIRDKLRIHILVDMDGYSNNGIRDTILFPLQTAPLQVGMLVYVGTTGAPYMQYIVTDPITSPFKYEQFYSEKLIHLNQSFFINTHASMKELDPPKVFKPRQENSEEPFYLCNFNKHLKISPHTFGIWMDIMRSAMKKKPNMDIRLRLLEFPRDSIPNLEAHMKKKYPDLVSPVKRLEFVPFINNPYEHQKRISKLCDLVVDNPIYNAHTMAVDTLYAGVPMLTFGNGVDMGGRVGQSILHELGLEDVLVAADPQSYKEMGVKLITDWDHYHNVQKRLVETAAPHQLNPFWDAKSYVRALEHGFLLIYQNFLAGNKPRHVVVPSSSDTDIESQKQEL